jgi:hypothetical protein
MKQEQIELLKNKQGNLELLQGQLKAKKQEFEQLNSGLIEEIRQMDVSFNQTKNEIKLEAVDEFKITGMKKLLGGIGIRVSNKLEYTEKEAIEWASVKMPIAILTVLDKKQFETYAKTADLEFVKKDQTISVTFPKEIII